MYRVRSASRKKHLFRCDNHCSEKAFSFWQFASVVKKEEEESYTTNVCQQCYNESLVEKGEKQLTRLQWYELVEKETHRGRFWKMMGKEQYIREMWEHYLRERSRVKKFREEAAREWQADIQGQWQQESPAREYLEQAKWCHDTDCSPRTLKQAILVLKGGDGEEYKRNFRINAKATEWAFDRMKEAF